MEAAGPWTAVRPIRRRLSYLVPNPTQEQHAPLSVQNYMHKSGMGSADSHIMGSPRESYHAWYSHITLYVVHVMASVVITLMLLVDCGTCIHVGIYVAIH